MANMIQNAKDSVNALLAAACAKAVEKGQLPAGAVLSGTVEIPKDTSNGDYAANHAMAGARALHMAPRKIAEALIENLDLEGSWFSSVEVAGPGFINFRLSPAWYADVLGAVTGEGADYGRVDEGHGKRLMVEFVSANPTGPMHMGNARGGVLGDALASVLDRAGYDVWREFYVNDAGNQIEKFASSIDARYQQLILGEDKVAFPEDGYHGEDIKELAKAFYDEHGESYLNKDVAERHAAMARFGLDRNIPKMQSDLKRYGVEYDEWFFESSTGATPMKRTGRSGSRPPRSSRRTCSRPARSRRRSTSSSSRTTCSDAPTAFTPTLPPTSPTTATSWKSAASMWP